MICLIMHWLQLAPTTGQLTRDGSSKGVMKVLGFGEGDAYVVS